MKNQLEKFNQTEKEFREWNKKMRNASLIFIKAAVKDNGDEIVYDYENDESDSVVYDGGRHPEYASNAFSNVERLHLMGDTLFVETEDADIEEKYLSTDELWNISLTVRDNVLPRLANVKEC